MSKYLWYALILKDSSYMQVHLLPKLFPSSSMHNCRKPSGTRITTETGSAEFLKVYVQVKWSKLWSLLDVQHKRWTNLWFYQAKHISQSSPIIFEFNALKHPNVTFSASCQRIISLVDPIRQLVMTPSDDSQSGNLFNSSSVVLLMSLFTCGPCGPPPHPSFMSSPFMTGFCRLSSSFFSSSSSFASSPASVDVSCGGNDLMVEVRRGSPAEWRKWKETRGEGRKWDKSNNQGRRQSVEMTPGK